MSKSVVIHSNVKTNEYFFSTDHCQEHKLGNDFVPITFYLPYTSIHSPLHIENKEELKAWLDKNGNIEIKNPDVAFQV